MSERRQRFQTFRKIININEQIIRNVELNQTSQRTHIFRQILQSITMQW